LGAIALVLAAAGGGACSSDEPAKEPCPKDNPECKEIATIEAGQQAVVKRKCVDCHGQDMSGSVTALAGFPPTPLGEPVELYPPNLTADPDTGTGPPERGGKWTDDALALAIRTGVDYQSQTLCPQMKHFSQMSDFEVYSIVKYLRDIPPVKKAIPRSVCPPLKTKDQQSMGR
jgi:hypothetical protein